MSDNQRYLENTRTSVITCPKAMKNSFLESNCSKPGSLFPGPCFFSQASYATYACFRPPLSAMFSPCVFIPFSCKTMYQTFSYMDILYQRSVHICNTSVRDGTGQQNQGRVRSGISEKHWVCSVSGMACTDSTPCSNSAGTILWTQDARLWHKLREGLV